LEQFITEKLLDAEARESGIRITDQEVTQYIDEIKKRNQLSDDDLKTALSREGQTIESYRASVKSELEKGEILARQVKSKVNITNDDVERYYKLNANKFRSEDRVRLRHILLALPQSATLKKCKRLPKRPDLYKRIVAGADFAELAREYLRERAEADGGDIGWVSRES
jgi:peptidyl-prolyl cis-trans isomerase SurA